MFFIVELLLSFVIPDDPPSISYISLHSLSLLSLPLSFNTSQLPSCLTFSTLCLETKSEGCRSWCRRETGGEIRSSPGVRTRSLPVPKGVSGCSFRSHFNAAPAYGSDFNVPTTPSWNSGMELIIGVKDSFLVPHRCSLFLSFPNWVKIGFWTYFCVFFLPTRCGRKK